MLKKIATYIIVGITLLSMVGTAFAFTFPPYRPDAKRKAGNGFEVRVRSIYPTYHGEYDDYLRLIVCKDRDNNVFLEIPFCLTPEYQYDSRSIFLRMKIPSPEELDSFSELEQKYLAASKERDDLHRDKWSQLARNAHLSEEASRQLEADTELKNLLELSENANKLWLDALENAKAGISQQEYVYYIVPKNKGVVIGPVSEADFAKQKEASGKTIHWKSAPTTHDEHPKGMTMLGGCLMLIIFGSYAFSIYVLPWIIIAFILWHILARIFKKSSVPPKATP